MWRPERNEIFWSILGDGEVFDFTWYDHEWGDEGRLKMGNVFRTKEEAEEMRDRIRELLTNGK